MNLFLSFPSKRSLIFNAYLILVDHSISILHVLSRSRHKLLNIILITFKRTDASTLNLSYRNINPSGLLFRAYDLPSC